MLQIGNDNDTLNIYLFLWEYVINFWLKILKQIFQ